MSRPAGGRGSGQSYQAPILEPAPAKMAAEEYLDRLGVTAYMKDMVTLLLENRPDQPMHFISDYFRAMLSPSTQLTRALRFIRLSPAGHPAFEDNLVSAYSTLDGRRGHVAAGDLLRLLRLLCADSPLTLARSILVMIDKRESDLISYTEFGCSVRAALQLEETLCRAEALLVVVSGGAGSSSRPASAAAAASTVPVRHDIGGGPDAGVGCDTGAGRDTGGARGTGGVLGTGGAASSEDGACSSAADADFGSGTDTTDPFAPPAYVPHSLAPRSLLDLILRQLQRVRGGPNSDATAPHSPSAQARVTPSAQAKVTPNDSAPVTDPSAACSTLLLHDIHASLVAPVTSKSGAASALGLGSSPGPSRMAAASKSLGSTALGKAGEEEMVPVREFYTCVLRAALRCGELSGTEEVVEAAISAASLRERSGDAGVPAAARALAAKLAAARTSGAASAS